jgi:hypothetical protein
LQIFIGDHNYFSYYLIHIISCCELSIWMNLPSLHVICKMCKHKLVYKLSLCSFSLCSDSLSFFSLQTWLVCVVLACLPLLLPLISVTKSFNNFINIFKESSFGLTYFLNYFPFCWLLLSSSLFPYF